MIWDELMAAGWIGDCTHHDLSLTRQLHDKLILKSNREQNYKNKPGEANVMEIISSKNCQTVLFSNGELVKVLK